MTQADHNSLDLALAINEIFYSLQGESTHAGRPCTFVRLKGCPLRCRWCDTEYAFYEGQSLKISEILARVADLHCPLVEVTGGEPLAQKNAIPLLQELVKASYEVMLETSGALSVAEVPPEVKIIMDLKAPGSGESQKNLYSNLEYLKKGKDEIKVVLSNREDFDFVLKIDDQYKLSENQTILLSAVTGELEHGELANWILESKKNYRFQHQLHKMLWPAKERGF
jgi:7-carboxy-7-deazaguanine synthase